MTFVIIFLECPYLALGIIYILGKGPPLIALIGSQYAVYIPVGSSL